MELSNPASFTLQKKFMDAPGALSGLKRPGRSIVKSESPNQHTRKDSTKDPGRPALSSKFSNDNLGTRRMVTKCVKIVSLPEHARIIGYSVRFAHSNDNSCRAWLQNIAFAARVTSASPQEDKPMLISNPEVVYEGAPLTNTQLGNGARLVSKPSEAFV